MGDGPRIDPAAKGYIDAIPTDKRAVFDRVHGLVLEVEPAAEVVLSYKMPTYVAGKRRLHVGVWTHGISLYGWREGVDGGFVARHPELSSGKGTLRITTDAAEQITDDELRALIRGALVGDDS